MICDPAVAEMFGLRSDPPVTPTQRLYCLDGVPRAEPRLSVVAKTTTWNETSPYSLTDAATTTISNTTGRPMEVMVVLDAIVWIDFTVAGTEPALQGVAMYYDLAVTTYPTGALPVLPVSVSPGRPITPALTVLLTSQADTTEILQPIRTETLTGRSQGYLPPLDPGWTYLFQPFGTWVNEPFSFVSFVGGTYLSRVTYSSLRWNRMD